MRGSLSRRAASRIRSNALCRPYRHCVRNLFCRLGLPSAKPLPSARSADRGVMPPPPLFAGFRGTMGLSDFPRSFIGVVLLADSRRGPVGHHAQAKRGISRFPCEVCPCVHGVLDRAESGTRLAIATRPVWPSACQDSVGTPKQKGFRGSIPGPHFPLSTLRHRSYDLQRMTRGQRGSLRLHCMALPSTTPYRLSGASRHLFHLFEGVKLCVAGPARE